MVKNAALVCALMGVALCAYADATPPPKGKPSVNSVSPSKASLNSFKMGSNNAGSSGTGNNASGSRAGKSAGANMIGAGSSGGKFVDKSSASNLNKAGTSLSPPASSLVKGASTKPQVKAPTRQLHPN